MKRDMHFTAIFVLATVFSFIGVNCKKTPTTPDVTYRTQDIVEFMYQRTLSIISPNNPDPNGMSIWHDEYGGFSPNDWHSIGLNQWMCSQNLKYNQSPYFVNLVDGKTCIKWTQVARTIFARIKGQSNWMELISIEPDPEGGERAKFLLYHNVINPNPSSSSFSR